MKFKKLTALLLSASMAVGLLAGCGGTPSNTETGTPSTGDPGTEATGSAASGESSLKGKRVRVVIASTSTGGDSYMIADMVTRYLGEEMGFNGKVDAIVVDGGVAQQYAESNPDLVIAGASSELGEASAYCVAVAKGDPKGLLPGINAAIAKMNEANMLETFIADADSLADVAVEVSAN